MAENNLPEAPEGAVYLPLTKGYFTLVDIADAELLAGVKLQVSLGKDRKPYAILQVKDPEGKKRNEYLHRFLTNAEKYKWVDHDNGDTLNNRRSNIRVCTPSENQTNRRDKRPTATSRYKGVVFEVSRAQWRARVMKGRKVAYQGRFSTEEEAARAYDREAVKHFGPFVPLNFPTER